MIGGPGERTADPFLFFERSKNMELARLICVDYSSRKPVVGSCVCGVSGEPVSHSAKGTYSTTEKEPRRVTCGASLLRDRIAGYPPYRSHRPRALAPTRSPGKWHPESQGGAATS